MGAFYGSVQFHSDDRESVLDAVRKYTGRRKLPILVGPAIRGWVGVYPAGNGQSEDVSKALAKLVGGDVLHLIVHDDDFFTYFYYRDGKVVDRFHSFAGSLTSVSPRTRTRLRGRPERLVHLLPDAGRLVALRELLATADRGRGPIASRHLERFAGLFDIANVAEAYEYMREQDGEGVEGWDQFVHVPDLSGERGRRLAAEVEAARATQRLQDKGVLLLVESRVIADAAMSRTPVFCPDGSAGFLVAWSSWPTEDGRPLEHYAAPWTAPGRPTSIDLGAYVSGLAASRSGRYLVSGHGYASIWEVSTGRHLFDVSPDGGSVWVGFSPDEEVVVALGPRQTVVARADTGHRVATVPTAQARTAAIHADGTLLVGTATGHLCLYSSADGAIRSRLLVGDREAMDAERRWKRGLLNQMLAGWNASEAQGQIEAHVRELEARTGEGTREPGEFLRHLDAMRQSTARQLEALEPGRSPEQGLETPATIEVSPCGRLIAVGTSRGARIYEWSAVRDATDFMPPPVARYDSLPHSFGGETNVMGGVVWKPDGSGVIFGGMDGRMECLDPNTGRRQVLCELPGHGDLVEHMRQCIEPGYEGNGGSAILGLSLSTDGTTLAARVWREYFSRDLQRQRKEFMVWDVGALLSGRDG